MWLESLYLNNFKNYSEANLNFVDGVNCIVGLNGAGKTNILDAIHAISFTKSAFNHLDHELIKEGESYFRVLGKISSDKKTDKIEIRLPEAAKKIVLWNDDPYAKLSEHIGKVPLVLINPNDTDLIRLGSELRRRFLDTLLSMLSSEYLSKLSEYQRTIRQRNALLKKVFEDNRREDELFEVYDEKLLALNDFIYSSRKKFIDSEAGEFAKIYDKISDKAEKASLVYKSDLNKENFHSAFKNNFEKDLRLQRTSLGIHRDDLEFSIEEKAIKKFASQGQQKSIVLALRLLQYKSFYKHFGFAPLLLLDDIFDKLDDGRMSRLMEILSENQFGQIFVTDAHPERSISIFKEAKREIRIFEIASGEIIKETD